MSVLKYEQLLDQTLCKDVYECIKMGHNVRKCTFGQFFSVLEKQSYFECMMFLESVSLYLTRLFQLFCEL